MKDRQEEVLQELRCMSKLLALMATAGMNQRQKIELLASTGMPPMEIAGLINTTLNAVRVTISKLRSTRARKRGGPRTQDEL
ncbi:hypothetical protein CH330_03850 [candidate division WOR-3 bacterium JGI_Cruoil_03_51_56]|uniref:HTH luxR-type domain-containing protein n=1 Tax=candidate division WOR-3 bacterium JGI_Cruoil_03_51_56 TaxID=1973747 RepID=A0A235BVC1_UNCW3|nr:MAG: hypothetical protein CH330_03850 [candidate division WOR-3 bacterium JGI_Cruoil_03_51_56]